MTLPPEDMFDVKVLSVQTLSEALNVAGPVAAGFFEVTTLAIENVGLFEITTTSEQRFRYSDDHQELDPIPVPGLFNVTVTYRKRNLEARR